VESTAAAGSVPALDHDRWFKELLTTFFLEFLDLFFPKLARLIDPDSLEFLTQEHFSDVHEGSIYLADVVVKTRYLGEDAYFLVHVEHQSTAPAGFDQRFFRYFAAIFLKHGVPVYPIVVYSHDAPRKRQPNVFRLDFPDGRVLRFHYRVVQLNRLPWRRFVNAANPVASALMSKMKIAPRDRPRVKAECLRLLLTLKLDPARMRMIALFVDAYLRLNDKEEQRFQRSLDQAGMEPSQREKIVEYVTSWEQRGIEKGLQQGLKEGRQEGRLEARREVLLDILDARFGPLDGRLLTRIRQMESIEELRRLTHLAATAGSIGELGF
jgi:hypothetical protein